MSRFTDLLFNVAGFQSPQLETKAEIGYAFNPQDPFANVLRSRDKNSAFYNLSEWWAKDERYEELVSRFTIHDINFICGQRLGDMASTASLLLFDRDAAENPITGMPDANLAIPRTDHPFYKLWDTPNPHFTSSQLKKLIVLTYMLSSNGVFLHINDGNNPRIKTDKVTRTKAVPIYDTRDVPKTIWPLLPSEMMVEEDEENPLRYFKRHDKYGRTTRYEPHSIMWMRNVNPLNYYTSMSVSDVVRPTTMFDMLATDTTTDVFRNGLRTSAILEADRDYFDTDEYLKIEAFWKERAQGKDNWNGVLPLWGGFRLNKAGLTPHEADYIAGTEKAHLRIIAAWGMHPALIFPITNGRYLFKQAENYVKTTTLQPILNALATSITNNILPLYDNTEKRQVKAYFTAVDALQEEIMIRNREKQALAISTSLVAVDQVRRILGDEMAEKKLRELGIVAHDEDVEFMELGLFPGGGSATGSQTAGGIARTNSSQENPDIIEADDVNLPLVGDSDALADGTGVNTKSVKIRGNVLESIISDMTASIITDEDVQEMLEPPINDSELEPMLIELDDKDEDGVRDLIDGVSNGRYEGLLD